MMGEFGVDGQSRFYSSALAANADVAADAVGRPVSAPLPLGPFTRLREAPIWGWSRRYYQREGQGAWMTNTVPSFVTTNAMTASISARVLFNALRDIGEKYGDSEPVTIVELGGGTGRFAHMFIRQAMELASTSPHSTPSFRYVLTDAFQSNVGAWEEHPLLTRWRALGVLELGRFDIERDSVIALTSGDSIGPGDLRTPLLVVAHYAFDATRHDAFRIQDGACLEAHTRFYSTAKAERDDPVHLESFKVEWGFEPTSAAGAYADEPAWSAVLEGYVDALDDTHLTIPWTAAQCLERLSGLSHGGLVALVSDKGFDRIEQLHGLPVPGFEIHGSMSMNVNLDALGRWCTQMGGVALRADERDGHKVMTIGLGVSVEQLVHTRVALLETVDRFGPADFLDVKEVNHRARPEASLRHLLGLLRLACWDPEMFFRVHERLIELAPTASPTERRELSALVEKVGALYFYLKDRRDVYFALGQLAHTLKRHHRAEAFFRCSHEAFGPSVATFYNRAICALAVEEPERAIAMLEDALVLEPGHQSAELMLEGVREVMKEEP